LVQITVIAIEAVKLMSIGIVIIEIMTPSDLRETTTKTSTATDGPLLSIRSDLLRDLRVTISL